MVVRAGGPDPNVNGKLRDVIAKAKANNVPNDNIDRIIKKAAGEQGGAEYEQLIYEGYGPAGVAVIVETLTDNRNRTAGDMRHFFDKCGGNLGQSGSVMFMFEHKGLIVIDGEGLDEDKVMEDALEAGADDLNFDGEVFEISTDANSVGSVSEELSKKGYDFISAEPVYVPATLTAIDDPEQAAKMEKLLESKISRRFKVRRLDKNDFGYLLEHLYGRSGTAYEDYEFHLPKKKLKGETLVKRYDLIKPTRCLMEEYGRYLRISHDDCEAYTAYFTISDVVGELDFPSSEIFYYQQQQFTFPVDTSMNVEIIANKKALSTVRNKKKELKDLDNHAWESGDETSTSIAEALDSVNELETELGQSKEAMYKLSYVVRVTAPDEEELKRRCNAVRDFYDDMNVKLVRPVGDMIGLHHEFIPASKRYMNDYIQYVTSDFLAGLGFGAAQMLGEKDGIYLAYGVDTGRNVYLQPALASQGVKGSVTNALSAAFLGSLGGGECLDHGAELVAQKNAVVGGVEADAVIGHAVLGLVVGTDLLGTVTVADLALALGTKLCLLLLELHLVQTGAQHLHADLAVLDLGALLLRLHHGVGGQVGDTHGGVGGVNALTARARSAVSIDAQVGLVDLDVNLLGLGKHGDGCRGGLDAALGLGLGNALDAVHAGLELHDGVDAVALDLELDGLKAAGLAGAGIEHGGLPATRLAKALVHLVQVAGEDGRLVATGGGADLDDGVLVVVGVARDEHVLDIFLELGKLSLVFGDVHLEHLLLIDIGSIVEHFLGSLDVVERADVLARSGNEVGLVRVLLAETRELLDVGGDGRVGKLLLELLVGLDDLFELVAHGRTPLYA